MNEATQRVTWHCAELYKVPTLDHAGDESFAFVNPKHVVSIHPTEITLDYDVTVMSNVKKTGTLLVTVKDDYFVPLQVHEVASLLYIRLESPNTITENSFAPPDNSNA